MGVTALGLCFWITSAHADSRSDAIETARLLAILLDSGPVTIAANQALINDPDKGYKGFTGDVFQRPSFATFQMRTGIDLTQLDQARVPAMAKPLLARLIEESKKTVDSYQPAINMPALKYKGLIPATFGTETATRFQSWSGVYMKQTTPSALVRNPKNKADEFEASALEQLERGSSKTAVFSATPWETHRSGFFYRSFTAHHV
jgi:general secretion pathway protein A